MCNPIAIVAGVGTAFSIGSSIAGAKATNASADANEAAALKSQKEAFKDIGLLQTETREQETASIFQAERRARATSALERAASGEAGVSGASAAAVLRDIERQAADFKVGTSRQATRQVRQLQREKQSGRTIAQNRISQAPRANPFLIGAQIATAGAGFAGTLLKRSPPVSTNPGSGSGG